MEENNVILDDDISQKLENIQKGNTDKTLYSYDEVAERLNKNTPNLRKYIKMFMPFLKKEHVVEKGRYYLTEEGIKILEKILETIERTGYSMSKVKEELMKQYPQELVPEELTPEEKMEQALFYYKSATQKYLEDYKEEILANQLENEKKYIEEINHLNAENQKLIDEYSKNTESKLAELEKQNEILINTINEMSAQNRKKGLFSFLKK